ncbi:MAG: phosphocholine cytidylyltransferase family protein [Bacteroidetes bacterium]|nr:MAG: phosphocholine cytidylyltransferase family protein [Bacteroidota bacterium]
MIKTAVILAAGMGTRLKERTKLIPKGFLELNGITLIERSIKNLLAEGIEKIVIGTGHASEYYEELATKYPQMLCVKNPIYYETGSLYTLFGLKNYLDSDFLLLESDLLYQKNGLSKIIKHTEKTVILASGMTHSNDEVFIETDENHFLRAMSKKPEELNKIDAELTGINKISRQTFEKMIDFAKLEFSKGNQHIHYEDAFVGVSRLENIFVYRLDDFIWCEIDDEDHLKRALDNILPLILQKEK